MSRLKKDKDSIDCKCNRYGKNASVTKFRVNKDVGDARFNIGLYKKQ